MDLHDHRRRSPAPVRRSTGRPPLGALRVGPSSAQPYACGAQRARGGSSATSRSCRRPRHRSSWGLSSTKSSGAISPLHRLEIRRRGQTWEPVKLGLGRSTGASLRRSVRGALRSMSARVLYHGRGGRTSHRGLPASAAGGCPHCPVLLGCAIGAGIRGRLPADRQALVPARCERCLRARGAHLCALADHEDEQRCPVACVALSDRQPVHSDPRHIGHLQRLATHGSRASPRAAWGRADRRHHHPLLRRAGPDGAADDRIGNGAGLASGPDGDRDHRRRSRSELAEALELAGRSSTTRPLPGSRPGRDGAAKSGNLNSAVGMLLPSTPRCATSRPATATTSSAQPRF